MWLVDGGQDDFVESSIDVEHSPDLWPEALFQNDGDSCGNYAIGRWNLPEKVEGDGIEVGSLSTRYPGGTATASACIGFAAAAHEVRPSKLIQCD